VHNIQHAEQQCLRKASPHQLYTEVRVALGKVEQQTPLQDVPCLGGEGLPELCVATVHPLQQLQLEFAAGGAAASGARAALALFAREGLGDARAEMADGAVMPPSDWWCAFRDCVQLLLLPLEFQPQPLTLHLPFAVQLRPRKVEEQVIAAKDAYEPAEQAICICADSQVLALQKAQRQLHPGPVPRRVAEQWRDGLSLPQQQGDHGLSAHSLGESHLLRHELLDGIEDLGLVPRI